MDFATIQAQLAKLTSQLSQYAERTTMPNVPTCGVSYGQGYPIHQCSQFTAKEDAWGYQGHSQSWDNMFSDAYNSDWRDYSDYMWSEPQQFQHGGYWQQEEEFYPKPYAPTQPQAQPAQNKSGSSIDNDQIFQLLTSMAQGMQTRDKKVDELEEQIGQIMEFMAQIQEQSELSNSTIENSKEDFEIHDTITLASAMKVGANLETSKHSLEVDEELLIEEEEEDIHTARVEQPLPQAPKAPTPSTTSKDVPNSFHSNVIPPNAPFPRRFLIPKKDESEKDILEAFQKVQSDIPILGATNQVPDCVELFKELCTPRRMIQEKVVAGEYQEFIKEDALGTTNPKEVEFDDTGQVTTIVVNLAKCKVPATFKDVVFVIEFVSEQASKPSSPISISFYTYMLLMIQAPTQEFKPLPDHFNYHLPFKDKGGIVRLEDVKASASWEATHAFNKGRPRNRSTFRFAFLNPSLCCL